VAKAIVSQYCGHWSFTSLARCILFREPKLLEEWECRQAQVYAKVMLSRHTIQATRLHAIFSSRNLDDNSNCEAGVISVPNGTTIRGQAAQVLERAREWKQLRTYHPFHSAWIGSGN
jgi:hypothetical protein